MKQSTDKALISDPSYSQRELLHIIEQENVTCLEDILLRRTSLAISGGLSTALIDEVLAIMANARGWNQTRTTSARQEFLARLSKQHAVTLEAAEPQPVNA